MDNHTDQIVDATKELARYGGADLTIEEIAQAEAEDLGVLDLIAYERAADQVVGAATVVRAAVRRALADRLGDGAARWGDYIYRNGSRTDWRVLDAEALADWLGPDWRKVVRVSGDNLRRTSLRLLAERRGINPQSVVETFIEVTYTDRALQVLPIEKAPKFLQEMEEGEVRAPRALAPGDDPPR